MKENLSKKIFLLGLTIFMISYLLPIDIFESYTSLRPTGLTSMFVCPIIGLIGLIFGVKEKDNIYSTEYYVNLITTYSNVCRSYNISNATKTRKW